MTTMWHSWLGKPSVHYSFAAWSNERWKNHEDMPRVDPVKHKGTPLCRVAGSRTFQCTDKFETVTCRGCLRRLALDISGEDVWRKVIIACVRKAKEPETPRSSLPGMAEPI